MTCEVRHTIGTLALAHHAYRNRRTCYSDQLAPAIEYVPKCMTSSRKVEPAIHSICRLKACSSDMNTYTENLSKEL